MDQFCFTGHDSFEYTKYSRYNKVTFGNQTARWQMKVFRDEELNNQSKA